jgi:PAS domain S-box-containing protein
MSPALQPPAPDANAEIARLIETLHATGQRLEELTAGEVDGVTDRDGRTFLLRHVQERLRHIEAAKQAAILNALPANIALLDSQGHIVLVNEAWRRAAEENVQLIPRLIPADQTRVNYLDFCDSAQGDAAYQSHRSAGGIRAVLTGTAKRFSMEYHSHLPMQQRWFVITVTPLSEDQPNGVVVMHVDITELKQAEQALEESRNLLQLVLENVPSRIFWKDRDLRYLGCNSRFAKDAGHSSPGELTGKTDFEMGWKDQAELYRSDDRSVLEAGADKLDIIEPQTTPDGNTIWLRTSKLPLRDKDDRIIGILGLYEDITERKQAEQALRESERRFSDLLGNIELVSMMLDRAAHITYCNEYLLRLTGWQREEVIGRDWFDVFIPPEIGDMKGSFFSELLSNLPDAWHHENEILTRSGERRLIRWNNSVLRSGDGEVIGTASIGEDITEQHRTQQALAKLQRQNELILESLEEGIYGMDLEGRITFQNPAAAKMLGYGTDELLGKPAHATMHYARADGTPFPKAQCPIRITLADGVVRRVEDEVYWRKDGSSLQIEYTTAPIRDEQDAIVGGVVAFRDVTERKQREQEILATKKQLQATLDAIPDLLFELGLDGRYYTYHSPRADLLAAPPEELLGRTVAEVLPADAAEIILAALREADATGRSTGRQFELALPQGRLWFELSVARMAVAPGQEARFTCLARDITERKNAEARIRYLNRVYAMQSGINTLIVHVRDRGELFQEACQVAVDIGGFRMALIGIVNRDDMKITPVASKGKDETLLNAIKSILSSVELASNTMVARAIRENSVVISNDSQNDPQIMFGKQYAEAGVNSIIILPLILADEVFGVLAIYASERNFFHDEELKLLSDLVGDISFAMEYLKAQEGLRSLNEELEDKITARTVDLEQARRRCGTRQRRQEHLPGQHEP